MTPDELIALRDAISGRHVAMMAVIDEFEAAAESTESADHQADAYAEALFLRTFTAYENDIEKLFLHYVTGGASLQGVTANSYLSVTDEALARKLTRAGYKFLSWAKPQEIRTTADTYIEKGWPLSDMMNAKSQDLSDCERVRNRIAHNSLEAMGQFNVAQRNLLQTERLFPITPGQFLRIRNTRLKKFHIAHYFDAMNDTLAAILDPPPYIYCIMETCAGESPESCSLKNRPGAHALGLHLKFGPAEWLVSAPPSPPIAATPQYW